LLYIKHYFSNLAKIKNQVIIFTDENLAQKVLDMRRAHGLADKTVIFTSKNFFLVDGEILLCSQQWYSHGTNSER
jgi:hypothetical protein